MSFISLYPPVIQNTGQKSKYPSSRSRVVILLGMHRSGTSLITRGLSACGLELGTNLIGATPFNTKGHWEDRTIYEINERVMELCRAPWDNLKDIPEDFLLREEAQPVFNQACSYIRANFSGYQQWAFKDPRTSRTLPFWQRVFQKCGVKVSYVFVIRNPRSVAESLERFNGAPMANKLPHHAFALWVSYLAPHFQRLLTEQVAIIDYDDFLETPEQSLRQVAQLLSLDLDDQPLRDYATHFVDEQLRHTLFDEAIDETTPYPVELAMKAYSLIKRHIVQNQLRFSEEAKVSWKRQIRLLTKFLEMKKSEEQLHLEKQQLLLQIKSLENEVKYLQDVKKSAEKWQLSLLKRWLHRWHAPKRPIPSS
jgi:hypothetical protein